MKPAKKAIIFFIICSFLFAQANIALAEDKTQDDYFVTEKESLEEISEKHTTEQSIGLSENETEPEAIITMPVITDEEEQKLDNTEEELPTTVIVEQETTTEETTTEEILFSSKEQDISPNEESTNDTFVFEEPQTEEIIIEEETQNTTEDNITPEQDIYIPESETEQSTLHTKKVDIQASSREYLNNNVYYGYLSDFEGKGSLLYTGNNLSFSWPTQSDKELWKLERVGTYQENAGIYIIENLLTGQVLEQNTSSSFVMSEYKNNVKSQQWYIESIASGNDNYLYIRNLESRSLLKIMNYVDSYNIHSTYKFKLNIAEYIKTEGISINHNQTELWKGNSIKLTANPIPSNATLKDVTWSSSNTGIAKISDDGTITGIKAGTTTVTASLKADKNIKASYTVTIKDVYGISLNKTNHTMNGTGMTYKLKASVAPIDAPDQGVTWTSNNSSIVTVDQDGLITSKKPGKTTIIATSKANTKIKGMCEVVVDEVMPSKITLNQTNATIKGLGTLSLSANVFPSNASNKKVIWKSLNTAVATVNNTGVVTGKALGQTTITATSSANNKVIARCNVTVANVSPSSVKLNNSSITILGKSSVKLTATVFPSNAINKTVTWSSSDPKIATVDSTGKVTSKALGLTTITATTKDGKKTAKCFVRVSNINPNTISIKPQSQTLNIGSSTTVKVTANPSNGFVIWKSSDTKIATVDRTGRVTGRTAGKVTISAAMGNKTAKTTLVIKNPIKKLTLNISSKTNVKSINLSPGATKTPTIAYYPSNTTDKKGVTWKSSNTRIATVDSNGKITAKNLGKAIITATAKANPKIKTTVEVIIDETFTKCLSPVFYSIGGKKAGTLPARVSIKKLKDNGKGWTQIEFRKKAVWIKTSNLTKQFQAMPYIPNKHLIQAVSNNEQKKMSSFFNKVPNVVKKYLKSTKTIIYCSGNDAESKLFMGTNTAGNTLPSYKMAVIKKNTIEHSMLHEIGHLWDKKGSYSSKKEFIKIFQSEKNAFFKACKPIYGSASNYYIKSANEYFAETFELYFTGKINLKKVTPKTYKYIAKTLK